MYKTIVVGTDGSTYAAAAVKKAIEIAKTMDAKLVILTVISTFMTSAARSRLQASFPGGIDEDQKKGVEEMLKMHLSKAKKSGLANVETAIFVTEDSVGVGIVKKAEELKADLIVVGSRGLTGISRVLLGSVADYVVEYASCDVEVVRT